MSGLFITMRNSLQTLSNFQTGLSVVNDNVSNANTQGYTRKRILFEQNTPIPLPFGPLGTGASISRIEGARDAFLERRLVSELQSQGYFEGQQSGLAQISQLLFNSDSSGPGSAMTRLFDAFSELTSDPGSLAQRQRVVGEASKLTREFSAATDRLGQLQLDNRRGIRDSVGAVNSILTDIAKLNQEIQPLAAQGLDGGALQDRRQALLEQLGGLMHFQTYPDEGGMISVVTTSGKALVAGGKAHEMSYDTSAAGAEILVDGVSITGEIQAGRLGGALVLDRQTIPSYVDDLNTLAESVATEINAIHVTGQDLNGAAGQPLFTFLPGAAATTLALNITDPAEIAAAAPGAGPGDPTVAQQLADLRDQTFAALGDSTFSDYYSQVVFRVGLESRDVSDSLTNQETIVQQLQLQRDSVSGVSLDEEALNLINFQRSYEAGARIIQVIDKLLEDTMNLVG